jgi:hypothetical protein
LHANWEASRHRTALVRYGFSAPVQTLARYGFLDGSNALFDYGCGRGDDVRGLVENGITASGWDPYHAPDNPITSADIVNLGFVVNVIEDLDERLDALTRAFSLAERLLVVWVMLANQNHVQGQCFRDGLMTRWGTFQKCYTQAEIKAFLEAALDEEPIPVAPGVLYVFRDKDAEQRFLVDRYRSRRNLLRSPTVAVREQLPPLLRVYVGCAALLYGDCRNADLVKIHIGSGKVSLMRYDDFEGQALPRMIERVKIELREQEIDYFAYGGEYEPPFLYNKSRYVNEESPNYPEQVAFEEALEGVGLFDFSGYGPKPGELVETLKKNRLAMEGFEVVPASNTPNPGDPCGQYLIFRQLIECGETRQRTGLPNLPKRPESYNALHGLAVQVLDPVIDYFGMIRLTYGFCSAELAKKIPGRIDPKRNQHAAHELNRLGNPVCPRLGAAADFIVEDESMLEGAQWIVANTPFERLYFCGDDKPIHVSYGPEHARQVVRMAAGKSGRLNPCVISREQFLALS